MALPTRRTTRPRNRTRALVAVLATSAAVASGSFAFASTTTALPDDLQFLDNATIDEIVAMSEGGKPECAALTGVLTLAFISAFWSMGEEFTDDSEVTEMGSEDGSLDDISLEGIYALFSPVIVPLIARAAPPADEAAASDLDRMTDELIGAIYELRDLGFTDDELLEIQALTAADWEDPSAGSDDFSATEVPEETVAPSPELEAKLELLVDHEFESITFLDEESSESDDGEGELPWAADCPETASMMDMMGDFSVSAEMEMTIDGTSVEASATITTSG